MLRKEFAPIDAESLCRKAARLSAAGAQVPAQHTVRPARRRSWISRVIDIHRSWMIQGRGLQS